MSNTKNSFNFAKLRKGFSLVELLVYLGSMTVVLLALTYVLANTYSLYGGMIADTRADRSAGTLMQILSTEIRSGAAIDQAESVFGTAHGQLAITAYDGTTSVNKVFGVVDGRVVLEIDGEETFMTPEDMEVSKFLFTQIVTPISYAVRFEIDLTYLVEGKLVTKTYPGVVTLRRSYD